MEDELQFDFERVIDQQQQQPGGHGGGGGGGGGPGGGGGGGDAGPRPRNYRMTVCTYWIRGLCMKGDTCGFLHQFDAARMPVCRNLLKFGACKEPDCPYKHTTDEIKECNMYKLGFCIYGPACRFKHTRQAGPPPDPERWEAAKPREFRNVSVVANQANEGILPADRAPGARGGARPLALPAPGGPGGGQVVPHAGGGGQYGGGGRGGAPPPPGQFNVDASVLAAVGQTDLRYGF